jgi:guanylate kinase
MIIVISGPSAVGKGTIIRKLLQMDNKLELGITCTTREKRCNEIEGNEYYFLTKEGFQKKIDKGELVEYSIVHGNFYGVPQETILKGLQGEKDIILQIDVQGAKKIKNKFDEAILIFIMPPDINTLLKRIKTRATESPEEVEKRLKRAIKEIEERFFYDYIILNEDLDKATLEILHIIESEREKKLR